MGAGEVDPDLAICAADVLSRQALENQAKDMAQEDALYALDKAMNNGSLDPTNYLKQVGMPLAAGLTFWVFSYGCFLRGILPLADAYRGDLRWACSTALR